MQKNTLLLFFGILVGIGAFLFVLSWVVDYYGYMGAFLLPIIVVTIYLLIRKLI